jgi:hypothetical protein
MCPCAATRPTAPDTSSQLKRAPVLPCVPQHRTPPPSSGGLRCCHVTHNSGPCLLAREGSGAAMRPMALNFASRLERALVLPHVPQLRTPPPSSGKLRCYHASRSTLRIVGNKNNNPGHAARPACYRGRCVRYQGKLTPWTYKMCGRWRIKYKQDVWTGGYRAIAVWR